MCKWEYKNSMWILNEIKWVILIVNSYNTDK